MKPAAIFAGLFQLVLFVGLSARAADATVTVNKTFSPASVAIGASSTVTILLQNTDTGADAQIMSLRDDIGSMGKAILDTRGATTGVCSGVDAVPAPPIPSLANNVYSLGPFRIPKAASTDAPATCTLTFQILGNQAGNGFNTIAAGDVVVNPATDNPAAITQTLTVTSANATIATRGNVTAIAPAAASLRYIIRNPAAGIPLTNVGFGIDVNSTTAYSIGGVTSTCGATLTTGPGAKTLIFSGGTIPAGGTCVVTIPVTGAAGAVVNTVFNGHSLTDDQLVTNPDAVSAAAGFSDKKPVLAKWFTPPFVQPAGNSPPAITQSRLSIHITNPVPAVPLTNAGITDTLPAGITLVSAPSPQCGGAVTTNGNVLKLSGATIGAVPCLLTAFVTATTGALNVIDKAAFSSDGVAGAANDAQARLNVTGAGGNYFMSKRALGSAPNAPIGSYGVNTPFQFELDFSSIAGSAFSGGTIADDLRTLPIPTRIVDDGNAHTPTSTNCGTPVFTDTDGGTSITAAGVTIPAGATCRVKFWTQFTSTTGTALTGVNTAQAIFGGIAQTANASVTKMRRCTSKTTRRRTKGS